MDRCLSFGNAIIDLFEIAIASECLECLCFSLRDREDI